MAVKKTNAIQNNQSKTINSLNTLIDILKDSMEINQEIMQKQTEEIMFAKLKEKIFFAFLEKESYDIIDVYEFINENDFNIHQNLKKDIIDELMNSHKEYREGNKNGDDQESF